MACALIASEQFSQVVGIVSVVLYGLEGINAHVGQKLYSLFQNGK